MILSFKRKINGKPTHFVEKILNSLQPINIRFYTLVMSPREFLKYKRIELKPKIHTIRKDKEDQWEAGKTIDFRTENMFPFASQMPVISTQEIFMTRRGSMLEITISRIGSYIGGDDFYLDAFQQGELSMNDGFDNYEDFRNYFMELIEKNGKATGNYWYKGKIIHWTNYYYD